MLGDGLEMSPASEVGLPARAMFAHFCAERKVQAGRND